MKAKNTQLPKAIEHFLSRANVVLLAFANYLQRKSNKMSYRAKKIFICIFCCSVLFECTLIAVKSFDKRSSFGFPEFTGTKMPEVKEKAEKAISKSDFERIQKLEIYIDTLSSTKKDSLLMTRPHLLDTLIYLENIYLKQ